MTYPTFNSGDILTATEMNAVGLWLISSGTITATTGGNFDNVFTADYANYRITVNATTGAAAAPAVDFALRASSTTLSGDWYRTSITSSNAAGPTRAWSATGSATCQVGNVSDARGGQIIIDVFQPQTSDSTRIISQSQAWGSAASNAGTFWNVGDSDIGTGFRLSCASNFTATVRIYGYR
jgi:hypothetical protein